MAVVNSTSDPITLPAITPVSWLAGVSDTLRVKDFRKLFIEIENENSNSIKVCI